MSGHNICFRREIRKIIFELSKIPPLIWSSSLSRNSARFLITLLLLIKTDFKLENVCKTEINQVIIYFVFFLRNSWINRGLSGLALI